MRPTFAIICCTAPGEIGSPRLAKEEMLVGLALFMVRSHESLVGQQRFVRSASHVDDPFFAPFAHDLQVAVLPLKMDILQRQVA